MAHGSEHSTAIMVLLRWVFLFLTKAGPAGGPLLGLDWFRLLSGICIKVLKDGERLQREAEVREE